MSLPWSSFQPHHLRPSRRPSMSAFGNNRQKATVAALTSSFLLFKTAELTLQCQLRHGQVPGHPGSLAWQKQVIPSFVPTCLSTRPPLYYVFLSRLTYLTFIASAKSIAIKIHNWGKYFELVNYL